MNKLLKLFFMKRTNFFFIVSFCFLIVISSCKKNESKDDEQTPTPTPINYLCDGNGKNIYFPLDSTFSWSYSYTLGGITQSSPPKYQVVGHETHDGKVYAKIEDVNSYYSEKYFREDISNHNIYSYNDYNNTEYLEIPYTPTLNQSWNYSSNTKKVTNLSASVTTASCSYSGLLEVSEYDNTDVLTNKYYYKKGLGLVYWEGYGYWVEKYTLEQVNIK